MCYAQYSHTINNHAIYKTIWRMNIEFKQLLVLGLTSYLVGLFAKGTHGAQAYGTITILSH